MEKNVVHKSKKFDEQMIRAIKNDDVKTVEMFLERGTHVDATNKDGETALILAAKYNSTGITSFLISKGAKLKKVLSKK